ncbi:hypothetical protein [Neolewinella persica]|uniref:hypothetical protein n=1 Tax=Neolewinella persica TaxID=70998 RepID=UPI0003733C2A|nr:hypothetical protein [Neolewinella persica]
MFEVVVQVARLTAAAGRTSWKYGSWAWPAAVSDGAGHPEETDFRAEFGSNFALIARHR